MRAIAALALAALTALGAWIVAREPAGFESDAWPSGVRASGVRASGAVESGVGESATAPTAGLAMPENPTSGGIVFREAGLRRTPGAWRLDAHAEIELPRAIRSGLDSGVPLEFVLEVELAESRRFLPDPVLLDVERRYGLVYYELTRHYRVRSLDDGTGRNYRSLGTALDGLGRFAGIALGGLETSAPGGPGERGTTGAPPLVARLALRLDGRALPLPLQSPFGSAWRLASASHVWTLPPTPGTAS